jgi:hypothetical protein
MANRMYAAFAPVVQFPRDKAALCPINYGDGEK